MLVASIYQVLIATPAHLPGEVDTHHNQSCIATMGGKATAGSFVCCAGCMNRSAWSNSLKNPPKSTERGPVGPLPNRPAPVLPMWNTSAPWSLIGWRDAGGTIFSVHRHVQDTQPFGWAWQRRPRTRRRTSFQWQTSSLDCKD